MHFKFVGPPAAAITLRGERGKGKDTLARVSKTWPYQVGKLCFDSKRSKIRQCGPAMPTLRI